MSKFECPPKLAVNFPGVVQAADAEQHMVLVRARTMDPATNENAKARATTVSAKLGKRQADFNRLAHLATTAPKMDKRIYWLHRVADILIDAAALVAPCRRGCSACCHQGVGISHAEAQLIAKETGKTAKAPPLPQYDAKKWSSTPCPMLVDSVCSIYEYRPMVCRTLINMDVDALLCQIVPSEPSISVPYMDTRPFQQVTVQALVRQRKDGSLAIPEVADIRDFFC